MKIYLKTRLPLDRDQVAEVRIKPLSSCVCCTLLTAFSTSISTCTHTSLLTHAWTQEEGPVGALGCCWLLWNSLLGLGARRIWHPLPGYQEDLLSIALPICSHFTHQNPALCCTQHCCSVGPPLPVMISATASCTASSDTVHAILLSAHVETIARIFTQHYFLQACGLRSRRNWPPSSPDSP